MYGSNAHDWVSHLNTHIILMLILGIESIIYGFRQQGIMEINMCTFTLMKKKGDRQKITLCKDKIHCGNVLLLNLIQISRLHDRLVEQRLVKNYKFHLTKA